MALVHVIGETECVAGARVCAMCLAGCLACRLEREHYQWHVGSRSAHYWRWE